MRTLILAGVLIALVATLALACRGTAEYPDAADDITQSTLTPERKKALLDQLNERRHFWTSSVSAMPCTSKLTVRVT